MDEDLWEQYGEFNDQIDGLRESLKSSIKTEIKSELERLRLENKELRDKQRNLSELEAAADRAKRDAEYMAGQAKAEAIKMRFEEILKSLATPMYYALVSYKKRPKCNNCNEDRRLTFTSPDGQETVGYCQCNSSYATWSVRETWAFAVYQNRDGKGHHAIYDVSGDNEIRDTSAAIYDGQDFSDIKNYPTVVFRSEEKCAEYVEYRRSKEVV